MTANSIRQHIPNFVTGVDPEEGTFTTLDELEALPFVARAIATPGFLRLSKNENRLMLELSMPPPNGEYWVLGYIERPDEVDLPQWVETQPQREARERWNRGEHR